MASHDKVRNFHQLSATDPNKKQMNNDEHPSSQKNISKNILPKAAYFLVDLAGTAWPSWHLAKFLPFRPCMLRLSAPTGSAARCNAEARFLITSSRPILGFCQRTPNGWSLFLELKHVQTKKERGHILSAKTVSRWSYQEMSSKLWNLQCNHNALVIGPSHPLAPSNLVKRTFAHPQLSPSEGIKKSSTRSCWRNKGKLMNFKPLCFSKPGHICFQHAERRVPTFPANALGQQRENGSCNMGEPWSYRIDA